MQSGLELTHSSNTKLAHRREARSQAAMALGVLGVAVLSFVLVTLPLSTLLWLTGVGVSCTVLASIPWAKREATLFPEDIADPALRSTYRAILAARGELELALSNAPGLASAASSLSDRCNDAVRMCARVASVANRLHAYLSAHDTREIARNAAQLRERATGTRDEATARNLMQAAAASEQQLAACEDLIRTRERIQSRLDHVLASLRAFAAAVVKQQTAEDEQFALAGESIAEHVDSVRQELGILESALQLEAA
jgi:hypothetical protein